jgi:Cu+-exporting ATPase
VEEINMISIHIKTLYIDGMSCAACSAKIEKKLNKLESVKATLNLATEKCSLKQLM